MSLVEWGEARIHFKSLASCELGFVRLASLGLAGRCVACGGSRGMDRWRSYEDNRGFD